MRLPLVLLLAAVLAGCSTSLPRVQQQAETFDVVVVSAHVEIGDCTFHRTTFDEECHVVAVHVADRHAKASAPTCQGDGLCTVAASGMMPTLTEFWTALPDVSQVDVRATGTSRLPPGGEGNITLRINRPQGSAPLTHVVYDVGPWHAQGAIPAYATGPVDADLVRLQVTQASIVDGRCFDGATSFDDECHVLTVLVDNTANSRSVSTDALAWSGTADGAVYDFQHIDVNGGDAVAGAGQASVEVRFTLEKATAVRLDGLRLHDQMAGISVSAPVPSY